VDIVLRLRELRRIRNLTQKQVAELAGVGEKTVSSFETGDRITSLKLTQLLRLLSAYNMTPTEFFGGRVDQSVLCELERLTSTESSVVVALRTLPDQARTALAERFLLMIDAVAASSRSMRSIGK